MQTSKTRAFWTALRLVTLATNLAIVIGASTVVAQNDGKASGSDAARPNLSWPVVNLNVLVLDTQGEPQKVDEREFQLFENSSERPIQLRGSSDSPESVALLIDSSGSLLKRKAEIVSIVGTIMHSLPPNSEVMAVLFANQAFIDVPFTEVSKVDLSFLDRLDGRGPTALLDALVATENHIVTHAQYARRALIVLSDGEDNASHLSLSQTLRLIAQPNAPMLYACRVPDGRNVFAAPGESLRGRRILQILVHHSGGVEIKQDRDPAATAAAIVKDVRAQYVLQYATIDPARNGKVHKLDVRLQAKDLQIFGLPAFFAPSK